METNFRNSPVIPLPNPGEGGPVADSGTSGSTPVVPLPNPGEGGPVGGGGSSSTPVIPLPNPGEGGPVGGGDSSNIPVIPLPNPGEGGPVGGGGSNIPVIPLPNPGEGGPVAGGGIGGILLPGLVRTAQVRFLNAAFGYQPFRVLINNTRMVGWLSYAAISAYGRVPVGYQTITVTGTNGYIYIQKTLPFQSGSPTTIAIINTPSGLDLLEISDRCCAPTGNFANFRVSNLALNSRPLDVLLADGRVVYSDVRYKETTSFKRMRPGEYQFLFAETNLTPMPEWLDIETLDSAFLGMMPAMDTVASLYLNALSGVNYTVFLLSSGTAINAVQALVAGDR
ncbi:DUF4397 domain-containing protein [uncultured Oscillibacter sp.]|nr:DUF4397 domain-containing protein [uncultured Oscillibacter sp.]